MSGRKLRPRTSRSIRQLAEVKLAGRPASDLEKLTPDEVLNVIHELEVHRIELEIQNLQLAEAHLAAEESKERYRRLYESAPIGYLTLGPEGEIVTANRCAAEQLRVPLARLHGRKLSSFIAAEHQDRWHFARRALAVPSAGRSIEIELSLDDGTTLDTQLVSPGRSESSATLNLALLNVTELRGAERALRRAASAVSLAEHEERRKLASDLHDDAGQLLSLASLKLRALADAGIKGRHGLIRELGDLLAEARRRITSLSFELSPPLLHDVGLVAATRWLVDDLARRYGLAVSVEAGEELALDEAVRVTLFRALRELLINVKRHAGTDKAGVRIWREDVMVRVAVEDDGIGFARDPEQGSFARDPKLRGFGLLALRERLGQLGGTLAVEVGPRGVGSRVVASLPFTPRPGGSS